MKKYTSIINMAVVLGIFAFAIPALAVTTSSLSPANINVSAGQSFNTVIVVNPQGVNNYTEKLEVDFPADILEVTSFTFGNNWMALNQPGYDLIDNIGGTIIKTAGYPGGFSESTTFGTITFRTKTSGSGVIRVGEGSLAFESNSQSSISESLATFNVSASPTSLIEQTQTSSVLNSQNNQEIEQDSNTSSSDETSATDTGEENSEIGGSAEDQAAAASLGSGIFGNLSIDWWLWVLLLLALGYLGWYYWNTKKVNK